MRNTLYVCIFISNIKALIKAMHVQYVKCFHHFVFAVMSSSSILMTEELQCSICLDVFSDPVTTPCGHNFCEICLDTYWNNSQDCRCPNCKETFKQRSELKINTTLRDLVDEHKKKTAEKPEVLCDICEEVKLKAVKSCLVCQSSYCETHLESHMTVTGLQKHKLVDPVNNLQDYICLKHERPLELFCRDDQTCMCYTSEKREKKTHKDAEVSPLQTLCVIIFIASGHSIAEQVATMSTVHKQTHTGMTWEQRLVHQQVVLEPLGHSPQTTLNQELVPGPNFAAHQALWWSIFKRNFEVFQGPLVVLSSLPEHDHLAAVDISEFKPNNMSTGSLGDLPYNRIGQLLCQQDQLYFPLLRLFYPGNVLQVADIDGWDPFIGTDVIGTSICSLDITYLNRGQLNAIGSHKVQRIWILQDIGNISQRDFCHCKSEVNTADIHLQALILYRQQRKGIHFIKDLEQKITEMKRRNSENHLWVKHPNSLRHQQKSPEELFKEYYWIVVGVVAVLFILVASYIVDYNAKKQSEAELTRMQQYAVDVTLNPNTAHPNLILSDDKKQVRYGNISRDLPDNPKRFYRYSNVLGKEGFSSGRFYFEVQVKGKTEWILGVVRESVIRNKETILTPLNGFWTLWLRNENEYKVGPYISLSVKVSPQKVGVFVDCVKGSVSFYDVESTSHIYSFTAQSFSEKLYPVFNPGTAYEGTNSAPLIITPINTNK
ncbi:zinc finger protein RFP-like [Paramisgurnus dabryanus]|uniref:zinc finger protein RFP-like n=1 Tax=Paramisgurnus dabryanus TaxID=90735 RepID=UPI003CCFB680